MTCLFVPPFLTLAICEGCVIIHLDAICMCATQLSPCCYMTITTAVTPLSLLPLLVQSSYVPIVIGITIVDEDDALATIKPNVNNHIFLYLGYFVVFYSVQQLYTVNFSIIKGY